MDRSMPEVLKELHQLDFDYADGDGIDFEPYSEFLSWERTQGWFHAWTGNPNADASSYAIFGQDGTGGYAAIWITRPGRGILEQPIVFFGSEGELGIIAADFSDYLWLLASGHGPCEAVSYPDENRVEDYEFVKFAAAHATAPRKKLNDILARARTEFPNFESEVQSLCK